MAITIEEMGRIQKMAMEIKHSSYGAAKRDLIVEDLAGLQMEIMQELGLFYPLLIQLLQLLEKERSRFDPFAAFDYGKQCGISETDYFQALMAYFISVDTTDKAHALYNALQRYHDTIAQLLGEKKELLTEMIELYRQVHGELNRSNDLFFRMGYDAVCLKTSIRAKEKGTEHRFCAQSLFLALIIM